MSVSTSRTDPAAPAAQADWNGAIPPLESGDRLSRDEFERRYHAMPHLKKAELIEGVVYVPSPVRCRRHGEPHSSVGGWLCVYRASTPGITLADNASVRMDLGNMPQPDCILFIQPESGGLAHIDPDDYVNGAPELVAEVAASSVSYDLHDKLQAYQRNGVREYIIWRVFDGQLDWFVLREKGYERLPPAQDGIWRSTVFPGLWLDPAALLRGDLAAVFAVVQQGLNSLEHRDFVARLRLP